ncbi:hypothetical protein QP518_04340 [Peptoniphilus harei]|uniref:hypothetical protein n=1 Tax=Peptoniphilus harei TaxID=54005 RepID=UPI00254DC71B|nr:hypothetical protein [Peptoniphilus harei]MDK7354973.1 hypothetical protein [Peptoniphilus harei]MDK7370625.1 hypothetical protein [Peptoniphilus harei]
MIEIDKSNENLFGKRLIAWDETTGKFAFLSPKILTSTVFNEKGESLDELLKITPNDLYKMVENVIGGAPEEYDTLKEISRALSENKDSIGTILKEISLKISKPDDWKKGQVLKVDEKGNPYWAEDKDTVYIHPDRHPASIIEEDESKQFVSLDEKKEWDKKLDDTSDLGKSNVTYNYKGYTSKQGIQDHGNETTPLGELLGYQSEEIALLMQAKQGAKYVATLDENARVPLSQLPDEALRDTTYDLSIYAKKLDLERTYAKIDTLSDFKREFDEELKKYALQSGLEEELTKIDNEIDKKESTIHKGAVNGYAALDGTGKIPRSQLPEEALRNTTYDLSIYAKSKDIEDRFATKEDVNSVKLEYLPENTEMKGKAGGYASLGNDGKVPASQLPSYVDDVLEFSSKSNFPSPGEKGKIYVDLATENIYRWSGSTYTEISPSLITQADIAKLRNIEEGAQKNNVTSEMIKAWNNKLDSVSGKDISRGKTDGYNTSSVWADLSTNRDLEDWIGDFHKRTLELKEMINKKPTIVSMSLSDYKNLTTKEANTLYVTY